jgi:hypothetical protein
MNQDKNLKKTLLIYLFIYTFQFICGILLCLYFPPSNDYFYLWYIITILSFISFIKFFFTLNLYLNYSQYNSDSHNSSFKNFILIIDFILSCILLFSFFYYYSSISSISFLYKFIIYQRLIILFILIPFLLIFFLKYLYHIYDENFNYSNNINHI